MHSKANGGSALLGGIIVAILLAITWMLAVWFTHNPVSLAGWAVGGLIGLSVARGTRRVATSWCGSTRTASWRAKGSSPLVLLSVAVVLVGALIFLLRRYMSG